ncbi:uncharacterized protein LOC130739100 [Lotus japonicus]|uniref:uncharacterized protein LOC130739100 n=1 Tax=Lotus japonicus TaxID=34305 RepID=UPI00258DB723|nr:uncharacterized protein LOC130739100 [Lotus japonicus]
MEAHQSPTPHHSHRSLSPSDNPSFGKTITASLQLHHYANNGNPAPQSSFLSRNHPLCLYGSVELRGPNSNDDDGKVLKESSFIFGSLVMIFFLPMKKGNVHISIHLPAYACNRSLWLCICSHN